MKAELTIDRTKELPNDALSVVEKELLKKLQNQFDDFSLVIRRAGSDGFSVYGGEKNVMTKVEEIFQHTWESADNWFY
ncbi:TPA: DinI-like family protein [Citrobacter amalonaticus]